MEQIIHYRFVNEVFTKPVKNYVTSVDPINTWFEDGEEAVNLQPVSVLQERLVTLTVDELKESMSKNEEVTINRETIIVSENTINNTVSLKKYIFSKTLVKTRRGGLRRYFKIKDKNMVSLTINKKTGDFSVYTRKKIGRNSQVFVRKNVSTNAVKSRLHVLEKSTSCPEKMVEAIKIFVEKLGYYDLDLSTYTGTIKYFYNTDPVDQYSRTGLHIFPFINYLKVNGINIISYHALYYFEWIFNKNKVKYRGCDIIDYMSDYYDINDRVLLQMILFKLVAKNEVIINTIDMDTKAYWFTNQTSRLCYISYTKLKLFYDLGKIESPHFYFNYGQYIDSLLPIGNKTNNNEIQLYPEIIKYYKYYGVTLSDYFKITNIEGYEIHTSRSLRYLKLFDFFGIKLKLNSLYDLHAKIHVYDKIIKMLFESVNKSGTYLVDTKSIQRIKLYFKGNYEFNFLTNVKFKEKEGFFEFNHIGTSEYTVDSAYIVMRIKGPSGHTFVKLNPITHSAYNYNPDSLIEERVVASNFSNKFSTNTNGLASAVRFKFIYSRDYFEKLCEQNGVFNIKSLVDYSTIND